MTTGWVKIFSSNHEYEPALIKMVLEAEMGIMSIVIDKRDSAYRIGDVELYVKPEDAIQAKHFIEKRFSDEQP